MNSSTYLVVEDASNQTTTVTARNDRRALGIPESPPPPYITPPGTILRNLTSLSASMKQIYPVHGTWLRRSAQYPQSSSGDRPSPGPSSLVNTETFGTNRTDYVASGTNRRFEYQPTEVQIVRETVQQDTTVEENNRHVSEENCDELVDK